MAAEGGGGGGDELEDVASKKVQKLFNAILDAQVEANSNPMLIHSLSALLASICPLHQPDIIHGILERLYALLPEVVSCMVELALQLLECQQDLAKINSVKFFGSAFMYRAILDSFDSKDGLKKFLNIHQSAASVQSGGGNTTPNPEVLTTSEKQIADYICAALRQYFRAHLLLVLDTLSGGALSGSGDLAANKPLDISNEAINEVFVQIRMDGELRRKLFWASWPVVQQFLEINGHITLLELYQAPTMEGSLHEFVQYIFDILHIVTFVQARESIVTAQLSNNRIGMAAILDAANAVGNYDHEVIGSALSVLRNLVCPSPPPISKKPLTVPFGSNAAPTSAVVEPLLFSPRFPSTRKRPLTISSGSNAAPTPALVKRSRLTYDFMLKRGCRWACEEVRDNNGINVLLNLLKSHLNVPPGTVGSIRALACRVLLGLAMDDTTADILTRLQVEKQLSKLISDSSGQPSGGDQGRQNKELTDVANELITTLVDYQKTAPFPFLALPIHIQESILSHVPVMYLIRFLNVSKDYRSLFSVLLSPTFPPPPPDLFFLLFSPYLYKNSFRMGSPKLLSFHPSSNRWIELLIPSNSPLRHSRPLVTSSSLAVTKFPHDETSLVAVQMFSHLLPKKTPPMISIGNPSVVAVIPDGDIALSGHFKIVATSYMEADMLCSQVYDSRRREWILHGTIMCCLELPHKAAVLNKSLYMRSCKPDQLLQFDLASGTWNYVLPMPECLCTHIFSYDQNIYLIVGQGRRDESLLSIRVFILDWVENRESPKWREISVLSEKDGTFVEFRGNNYVMSYFDAVDRNGFVCLFNKYKTVLLFDVRNRSWVLVPPCPMAPNYPFWYGHATEMGLEVLRPVGAK